MNDEKPASTAAPAPGTPGARPDWNERYKAGDLPWDTGVPDHHLTAFVESGAVPAGARVFEVGCGTGTNAVWLASQGFDVTACDLAPTAVERAIARAEAAGVSARCRFQQLDFLAQDAPPGPYDFVVDRGVLHVFDEPADRARFAARVAALLGAGGQWLSLVGSTEGPERDFGPPRRSARDLADAVEPSLEIVSLTTTRFDRDELATVAAWVMHARVREVPAVPSTRR